ncbi:MAG TPA: cellulase family glycosylhydrolase [Dehalococcoidia bacterium]|nr:cellulase family glycosylhydrolase [Dehalococcoidia bacterium]
MKSPTLTFPPNPLVTANGDGTYTVAIPALVKVPAGYSAPDNGLWAMAKGDAGFSQVWAALKNAQASQDPQNPFERIPVQFTLKSVKPGLWNEQFGLFTNQWGNPLAWIYPGMDFEVGGDSWEHKAPADRIPPRLRVEHGRFVTASGTVHRFYADDPAGSSAVTFLRGGNYGNALDWTLTPALNTPGYFTLLGDMGCHFVRVLFSPDRYLSETAYTHAVDQVVQNIWAAGLYPLIAPQDLPQGDTLEARAAGGLKVVQALAEKYKGRSVWLEVCNEPHEYGAWAAWKPVAERYVKAIRAIDPDAFVVVPFEGWSKDGRAAARDPITDVAVDLYDGHAYVDPAQVSELFGTPARAGLPVLIGEYGGGADYLRKMDLALQRIPRLMAIAPWALTVKGQDSMPLIADGSTAVLRFTPAGQVIADDYARWDAGKKVE